MKLNQHPFVYAFALLVFLASSNFAVGVHWCGGSIQHISFLEKAEGCAMERRLPPCHRQETAPCCQDAMITYSPQEFKVDANQISCTCSPAIQAVVPAILIAETMPPSSGAEATFFHYSPPLRSSDRTISLQVFLI